MRQSIGRSRLHLAALFGTLRNNQLQSLKSTSIFNHSISFTLRSASSCTSDYLQVRTGSSEARGSGFPTLNPGDHHTSDIYLQVGKGSSEAPPSPNLRITAPLITIPELCLIGIPKSNRSASGSLRR